MKKTLIAMAAVAVAGVASAQVSITGAVAFSLQNTVAAGDTVLDLSDADINFSASEDLGGGMKVSAATSISNEALRGNGTTANNTSISISGGFGTLAYANVLSGQSKLSAGASLEDDMSDAMGGYTTVNVLDYTLPAFIPNASVTLEWAAAPQTPDATTDFGEPDEIAATPLDPIDGAAAAIDAAEATATPTPVAATPIAAPAPAPAPAPKPAPAASNLAKPFIQIGIFSIEANATGTADKLRGDGMSAKVIAQESQGRNFWRVIVGPTPNEADRAAILSKVKALGFTDAYFVTN